MEKMMRHLLIAMLGWCGIASCLAWELQPQASSISFVVKTAEAAETYRFNELRGTFDNGGMVLLTIPLASVSTGVEERDEKVRDLLFEAAKFPSASFLTMIGMDQIEGLAPNSQKTMAVSGRLTLRGKTAQVAGTMQVSRLANGNLSVVSAAPVLLDTEQFELNKGMKKVMRAGGVEFDKVVPINVHLVFTP
jgi:polyisoprenoid-binding protein YceI